MELTQEHFHLIAHSLGVNLYHAKQSKNKRDKVLPEEFYRNYFASSSGGDDYKRLQELETLGMTESWQRMDYIYFQVTPMGIETFRNYFHNEVSIDRV